jgi:hypothetical protein
VDQSQAQTGASDAGGVPSQQLSYLTRQADYLASRLEGRVADSEFATIAQTSATMRDSEAAKRNWSLALDAVNALDQARRPLYRLQKLRGYAQYLYSLGEFAEGRKRFQVALTEVPHDTGLNLYVHGFA